MDLVLAGTMQYLHLRNLLSKEKRGGKVTNNRIVATGMGAITPIGIGVASYWDNLIKGKSGVTAISRFDVNELPVKIAAEVKDFKPTDFLARKVASQTDIFAQFALIAAAEAIEQSHLKAAPERVGIVIGTAFGGLTTAIEAQEQISNSGSYRISPRVVPNSLGNIAAAHIGILHNLRGPSLTVTTACSSGGDAIGVGTMMLKSGQADAVVVVGAESTLFGMMNASLAASRALSQRNDDPAKACRPFDLERDGFVMGEGGGALVIETLDHAKKRDAEIKAEILGYGNCSDSYHITAPHPEGRGEIQCMEIALKNANLEPAQIEYINAHGTSTPMGDKIETETIKAVFGQRAKDIPVSSTKGATGHMMGAGGVTELIACIQAIREGILPPTLNYEIPDPQCDLDYVPNTARNTDIKIAMSNSFGFGGQNTSLIIGRYE
jgi:3-oxoacyl-[acyl-carrier-protein] synthase II